MFVPGVPIEIPLSQRLRSQAANLRNQAEAIRSYLNAETPEQRAEREAGARAELETHQRRTSFRERIAEVRHRGQRECVAAPGVVIDPQEGLSPKQEAEILRFEAERRASS